MIGKGVKHEDKISRKIQKSTTICNVYLIIHWEGYAREMKKIVSKKGEKNEH